MSKVLGKQLKSDPRIRQAKKLIQEALKDYQKGIVGIRDGLPQEKQSYQKAMERLSQLRGRPLFFPYIGSGLGRGALVELDDGSVKYDFITGIGVYLMGHSHMAIVNAGIDAAIENTVMQGNLQFNAVSADLMDLLVRSACTSGARLKHCVLTTSGAMANENALKIIFQKKYPAKRLLAFQGCFAGRTLAVAQITDRPDYREGLPKTLSVDHIPFFDPQHPKESTAAAVHCLETLLQKYKGRYAAMCFELIQGERGAYIGDRAFFTALMKILKKHNVAVLVDEIQTFGRTSRLFAFQHFGLDRYVDVVTVGKMSQVCATLFAEEYTPRPGLISQTFTSSTSALHAGKVTIETLLKGGYFGKDGRIEKLSRHFIGRLEKLSRAYPDWIKGPFGCGAMIGFTYADGSADKAKVFLKALYEAGVMAFTAGRKPVRIRFLMPVGVVTQRDIDHVCRIIQETLSTKKRPGTFVAQKSRAPF